MIYINKNEGFEYVSSGLFKSDGSWCHPRRIIDTYEIIFMYYGTAYICEGGIEYTLKQDDVLILSPGREHYGFCVSDESVSFAWLHYRTDCKSYKNISKHFKVSNAAAPRALFSQLMHTANTPGHSGKSVDLYAALYTEEILRNEKAQDDALCYLAARIKDYVIYNSEKNLSVKSIAACFGYHENHIGRIFKSAYDLNLKDYICVQRITYACSMLGTTIYTVKQISQIMNFKNENNFVKFFKYHTELTPSEYRRAYINKKINKK